MPYDFVTLLIKSVNLTNHRLVCLLSLLNLVRSFKFLISSSPLPQTGAGLWPAGLCVWTVPSGGVHVDLHVPVCVAGSLHPVPPVVTDPVWVLQSPQVVQFAVWLCVPALPSSGSGIPAYVCGSDQQFATCILLHHHPGTGKWQVWLFLVSAGSHPQLGCCIMPYLLPYVKKFQMPFEMCYINSPIFIICLIPGASNDESTLLCQGECTKSPGLG